MILLISVNLRNALENVKLLSISKAINIPITRNALKNEFEGCKGIKSIAVKTADPDSIVRQSRDRFSCFSAYLASIVSRFSREKSSGSPFCTLVSTVKLSKRRCRSIRGSDVINVVETFKDTVN